MPTISQLIRKPRQPVAARNKVPGTERTIRRDDGSQATIVHHMGTDSLGRDVYTRVVYGARVSLMIGISVAVLSVVIGLVIGAIVVLMYMPIFELAGNLR